MRDEQSGHITCKQLTIVDEDGNTKISMSTDNAGNPAITMVGESNTINISFTNEKGSIVITDKQGNGKLELFVDKGIGDFNVEPDFENKN